MKMNNVLILGAALLLAPLTSTLAQSTWETVDLLAPALGYYVLADSNGNFVSTANDQSSTNRITNVSVSTDHGLTWQSIGQIPEYGVRLAQAPDGTLYGEANAVVNNLPSSRVWQSVDHGATWTMLSNPSLTPSGQFGSVHLAAGNSGTVYLCGRIWPGGSGGWTVRKGVPTSNGYSWSTVDSYSIGNQANGFCLRPATAPGQLDEVFVCGYVGSTWIVRHSLDSGATWTTLDSYNPGVSGQARGAAVGPDGSIYVAGVISTTVNKTTQSGWLVRKSTNHGVSWTNVDYVANASPYYNSTIAADAFGRVLVVGYVGSTWMARGSSDGGATWTTTDLFLPTGYSSSIAYSAACDAFGNFCVTGSMVKPGTSGSVTPIRRLAAP
jgi:hypothetical protein